MISLNRTAAPASYDIGSEDAKIGSARLWSHQTKSLLNLKRPTSESNSTSLIKSTRTKNVVRHIAPRIPQPPQDSAPGTGARVPGFEDVPLHRFGDGELQPKQEQTFENYALAALNAINKFQHCVSEPSLDQVVAEGLKKDMEAWVEKTAIYAGTATLAIQKAVKVGNPQTLEVLLRPDIGRATIDSHNSLGETPLQTAAKHLDDAVRKARDQERELAIMEPTRAQIIRAQNVKQLDSRKAVLRILLAHGASIDAVDGNGRSFFDNDHAAITRHIVNDALIRGDGRRSFAQRMHGRWVKAKTNLSHFLNTSFRSFIRIL